MKNAIELSEGLAGIAFCLVISGLGIGVVAGALVSLFFVEVAIWIACSGVVLYIMASFVRCL